jgi:ketosteroid isomerase-like protein
MRVCAMALLWVAFLPWPAAAADWTPDEQAVWQLEEDYWRYVSTGDVDAYVQLWHEDFIGWPCFELEPKGKADIGSWVREIRDKQWKLTYVLKPLANQSFGDDVVVVHYAAEYVYDYGDGTKSGAGLWRKFTHTWMRMGDSWQIVGGMCAAQEPVKAPRA